MAKPEQVQLAILHYKKNTYVNIEGKQDAGRFYIIRDGQVQIAKEAEIIEEDTGNILYAGDFFNVVSCMANHPAIETAKALKDVSVVAVYRDQFGILIQKYSPIAMKIIKSFSHKLRYFDSAITRLSFKGNVEENARYLYNIGDYYLKRKQLNHAFYALKRFIQYCPTSDNVGEAKKLLMKIQPHVREDQITVPSRGSTGSIKTTTSSSPSTSPEKSSTSSRRARSRSPRSWTTTRCSSRCSSPGTSSAKWRYWRTSRATLPRSPSATPSSSR